MLSPIPHLRRKGSQETPLYYSLDCVNVDGIIRVNIAYYKNKAPRHEGAEYLIYKTLMPNTQNRHKILQSMLRMTIATIWSQYSVLFFASSMIGPTRDVF